MKKVKAECTKCKGTGRITFYSHIAGGQCFDCKGQGFKMLSAYQLEKAEKERQYIERQIQAMENDSIEAEFKVGDTIKDFHGKTHKIIAIEYEQYVTNTGSRIGIFADGFTKI